MTGDQRILNSPTAGESLYIEFANRLLFRYISLLLLLLLLLLFLLLLLLLFLVYYTGFFLISLLYANKDIHIVKILGIYDSVEWWRHEYVKLFCRGYSWQRDRGCSRDVGTMEAARRQQNNFWQASIQLERHRRTKSHSGRSESRSGRGHTSVVMRRADAVSREKTAGAPGPISGQSDRLRKHVIKLRYIYIAECAIVSYRL